MKSGWARCPGWEVKGAFTRHQPQDVVWLLEPGFVHCSSYQGLADLPSGALHPQPKGGWGAVYQKEPELPAAILAAGRQRTGRARCWPNRRVLVTVFLLPSRALTFWNRLFLEECSALGGHEGEPAAQNSVWAPPASS